MGVQLPLIEQYLGKQQDMRAVARFSELQESGGACGVGGLYEAQIPLSAPGPGQQYGFRVDLDACTGCKACVVGCNKLNGLDGDEAWRAVGTLHSGGTAIGGKVSRARVSKASQQTVTTACHHCVEPACMKGCPVGAYEKDAKTGIVRHLDDQCIGCQYCTLTCPYEVPQYNERLGIVRKCDMCTDRLTAGEAPACVQSCPTGAITITLVDVPDARRIAENTALVPGAPPSRLTTPTTTYHTSRDGEDRSLPADYFAFEPAKPHLPLVVLLVSSQLSVGVFVLQALLAFLPGRMTPPGGALALVLAAAAAILGLLAAPLHLGRPLYAFRAFIGFRTSWMSREAVFLGAYGGLAALAAGLPFIGMVPPLQKLAVQFALDPHAIARALVLLCAVVGLVAVFCSAMLYVVTGRLFWAARLTHGRFFGTTLLLGLATLAAAGAYTHEPGLSVSATRALLVLLIAVTIIKLAVEGSALRHQTDDKKSELWRSAELMSGPLFHLSSARNTASFLGGIAAPGLLLGSLGSAGPSAATALALLMLGLCVVGELLERALFFMAVAPLRMPGNFGKVSRA
jgi:formate dehydrogenase iron-sulfur subunit